MKKLLGILVLGLLLSGCGTTSSEMEKGNVKIGMTKDEFCIQVSTFRWSQNPCLTPLVSGLTNVPGVYYPETKMEIMHDTKKQYFLKPLRKKMSAKSPIFSYLSDKYQQYTFRRKEILPIRIFVVHNKLIRREQCR